MSGPDKAEYAHNRLGSERFLKALSGYDTQRRVDVLVNRFLPAEAVKGRAALDVGCGLGFFSRALESRGALVTATDIGPALVEHTRASIRGRCEVVDALHLADRFGEGVFDVVLSSECIEHTRDPGEAVRQMVKVLRVGGHLALSTPNRVWSGVVRAATVLRLRPFDGFENFSSWSSLRRLLEDNGCVVVEEFGLHILPFQLPLRGVLRWADDHLQCLRGVMINICIHAEKVR